MAERPVFVAAAPEDGWVKAISVQFTWYPGFSIKQKQASIAALHAAFQHKYGKDRRVLEISRRSPVPVGQKLSAFNLKVPLPGSGQRISVESAFQGSKVFAQGGPYQDLYHKPARAAKTDHRIRTSGPLEGFMWLNAPWPTNPTTAFYDWLYIQALLDEPKLAEAVLAYDAFTDIEFNPAKSLNCQARAAAFFQSLMRNGAEPAALRDQNAFLLLYEGGVQRQLRLF